MQLKSYDVVIVGGGVIGAAILAQIAANRKRSLKVALIEKSSVGLSGPTAKSGGMLRTYHPDSFLSDLAFESMPYFINFEQLYGEGCGYTPTGLVVIESMDRLKEVQQEVERINYRQPILKWGNGSSAPFPSKSPFITSNSDIMIYEERAGFASPMLTTQAWINYGRVSGLDVIEGVQVSELLLEREKVIGVKTTAGTIEARVVIVAAGAWSKKILEQAIGQQTPLQNKAIQMNGFIRPSQAEVPLPFIDYTNELYGKQGSGPVHWIGLPVEEWDIDPDKEANVDLVLAEKVRKYASERLDWMHEADYAGGKRSFDAYSPNGRGWMGQIGEIEGLYVCTGWSGGGFKIAPAVGRMIAEEIDLLFK